MRWINKGPQPELKYFFYMIGEYIKVFFCIFIPIFFAAAFLDSWFYGLPTCVPYNFIEVNVFQSLS